RQAEDHALVQSADRVLGPLQRRVGEEPGSPDVPDTFEAARPRGGGTGANHPREGRHRREGPPPRPGRALGPRTGHPNPPDRAPPSASIEASESWIPLTVSSLPPSPRPTSWTRPSHGLRTSGVPAAIGRCSDRTPRVKRALNDG